MAQKKIQTRKSLGLTEKVATDLQTLCTALGINEHSYIVNELAKSIQRDSISLLARKEQQDSIAEILKLIEKSLKK